MPGLANYRVPPPSKWEDFESLCADLWRGIWQDNDTQRNGRLGQPQHGVDVFGRPGKGSTWAGVQCKGKYEQLGSFLTEQELRREVEKAKGFKPGLSAFTVASTGPRDANAQEHARLITEAHLRSGLFPVQVWSWDDILERLADFPAVATLHFPHFQPVLRSRAPAGADVGAANSEFPAATETPAATTSRLAAFRPPVYARTMIVRERLSMRIEGALREGRSVYVSAPPGYGKSVLLSQLSWPDAAWVDCEADVGDFGALRSHLNRLLQAKCGLTVPSESPREFARSLESAVRDSSGSGPGLLLILDHVDGVDKGVRTFIEEVVGGGTNLRLALAGSALRLKRQKALEANGRLETVSASDLAFTREETGALITAPFKNAEYGPSSRLGALVFDVTAGWPIAVQLIRAGVERDPDEESTTRVLDQVAEHELGPYLLECYWGTLDVVFRSLLVRTAIYPTFDRSDAQALMPGEELEAPWKELESGPFVRHSPASPSLLIYQPLFHVFLNERLREECSEEQTKALHRAATLQFLKKRMPPGALHHARRSGDSELLLDAARAQAEYEFLHGVYPMLLDALDAVAPEARWQDATLSVYQGRYLEHKGDLDDALRWYRRAQELFDVQGPDHWRLGIVNDLGGILRKQKKETEAIAAYDAGLSKLHVDEPSLTRGQFLANRSNVYLQQGAWKNAEDGFLNAKSIFELHRDGNSLALVYQGLAATARGRGETARAYWFRRRAVRWAAKSGNVETFLAVAPQLAEELLEKRKYNAAHRLYAAIFSAADTGQTPAALPLMLNNFGVTCTFRPEPDEAGIPALRMALEMKRAAGMPTGGTLQNLTNLLMRLGHLSEALVLSRQQWDVARHRRDKALEVDAQAKIAALEERLSIDSAILPSQEMDSAGTDEARSWRRAMARLVREGCVRNALRDRWPLLSEFLDSDANARVDTTVTIGEKTFHASMAKTVLFLSRVGASFDTSESPLANRGDENLILELVTEDTASPSPAKSGGRVSDQLAAIWWVRAGLSCWVQAVWVDRKAEGDRGPGLALLRGLHFAIDSRTGMWAAAPHPDACECGRSEVHHDLLDLAESLVRAHRESKESAQRLVKLQRAYTLVSLDDRAFALGGRGTVQGPP